MDVPKLAAQATVVLGVYIGDYTGTTIGDSCRICFRRLSGLHADQDLKGPRRDLNTMPAHLLPAANARMVPYESE